MEGDDVKRLRELEAENAALKWIVAEQARTIDATGRLLRKNGVRPPSDGRGPRFWWAKGSRFAAPARPWGSRAAATGGVAPEQGLPHRPRAGAARARNAQRQAGPPRVEGGEARAHEAVPQAADGLHGPLSAKASNEVWSLDFVFDACLNGTELKILSVKDEFTKGVSRARGRDRLQGPRRAARAPAAHPGAGRALSQAKGLRVIVAVGYAVGEDYVDKPNASSTGRIVVCECSIPSIRARRAPTAASPMACQGARIVVRFHRNSGDGKFPL